MKELNFRDDDFYDVEIKVEIHGELHVIDLENISSHEVEELVHQMKDRRDICGSMFDVTKPTVIDRYYYVKFDHIVSVIATLQH